MKEVINHTKHLEVTFDRILTALFSNEELDSMGSSPESAIELMSCRKAWIKTSALAVEGVSTENMALTHLLWFQHIGRVVIEDIDPFSGAVLVHLNFKDIAEEKRLKDKLTRIS